MSEYRRPKLSLEVYRDEQCIPIDYGNRWKGESPPDDAYSHVGNPERFTPLHVVATALIGWLQDTFDVVVEQDPAVAADLLVLPDEVTRAVRVTPRNPAAAPLTFVLTPFPGVYLHAGSLQDFHFPVCGCDACDDNVVNLLEDLEWTVRAVVSGGYSERFDSWPARWVEYELDEPGVGMRSGRSGTEELPDKRVKLARTVLPTDGRWLPWQNLAQDNADAVE